MIAVLSGLVAGFVHVLAGPDHLAAIAPLAIRDYRRSWWLGTRWGLGHSAGVMVVGLAGLGLRHLIPLDSISTWSERLVGILLLCLGTWSIHQAVKFRVHRHTHDHGNGPHQHFHFHPNESEKDRHSHKHAAFGIGTLHGLAGSSHLLGVIPSLAFPTVAESLSYLLMFGLGTIGAMTLFASAVGTVSSRFVDHGIWFYRGLMGSCGMVALGLGSWWLLEN
jgi:putative Mn2+ efflux pump MntP